MKYRCKICNYSFEGELNDDYICPICKLGAKHFELVEEENKVENLNRIEIKDDNPSVTRINENCVNCGICIKTCENIVGIKKEDDLCISCGQCILTCPVASLIPKDSTKEVLEAIKNPNKEVVVITSPAVRVAIGDAFGFSSGDFLEGKMISALKTLGFNYVFDTSFGADLTAMEEAAELLDRVNNNGKLPMFTSCCPAWVKYAGAMHPNLTDNISGCKSPIGMISSFIRNIWVKENDINNNNLIVVALTPCTAKKMEIIGTDCDYVITTSEFANILKDQNIDFSTLADQSYDELNGSTSGTIFGTSGGVMLSALRTFYYYQTDKDLKDEQITITNRGFYNEYSLEIGDKTIKTAAVSTMPNLEKLLPIADEYVFIEVMNCNGGCVNGGGQIIVRNNENLVASRQKSLINNDKESKLRYPYQNPAIKDAYEKHFDKPLSSKCKNLFHK